MDQDRVRDLVRRVSLFLIAKLISDYEPDTLADLPRQSDEQAILLEAAISTATPGVQVDEHFVGAHQIPRRGGQSMLQA